jgi:hypothetical protein
MAPAMCVGKPGERHEVTCSRSGMPRRRRGDRSATRPGHVARLGYLAAAVIASSCADNSRRTPAGGIAPPFFRDHADREVPPFVGGGTSPPAAAGSQVSISIDAGQTLRTLPRTLYGNNAATWVGDIIWSETSYERLRAAGASILRFPGGSTADVYHWDGQYPPHATGQAYNSESWAVSTAEYLQLVRRLGSIPVITANHGYASYDATANDGNVENAARLAADWVEYCNAPNDGTNPNGGTDWAARRAADGSPEPFFVAYWEIGNEVFGAWETGHDPVGSTYAANFSTIADAMKAVDPTIAIGLVVDPTPTYENWTKTVLSNPGTADRADFLIVHTYFAAFASASAVTAPALLAQATHVRDLKTSLDGLVAGSTTRSPAELPTYLSEYNVPGPVNSLQISLASGLFIAKVLGELAGSGWAAASLWDVLNGYDDSGTYGPGDHGFLSLRQPNVPDLTPRPTYYAFYFFARNFGDRLVAASSSDPAVSVYASRFTGDGIGVVAVNESTTARTLSLSIEGASSSGRSNVWILTGPSVEGPEVTLNGVASGYPAGGPLPDSVVPYTVAVTGGALAFDVPGSSVTNIVIY